MNAAEIKLELFRKIDRLPKADLENLYHKFIALLDTNAIYKLNELEKKAIEEALEQSEEGKLVEHLDVLNEASAKYPNLKFK
jgi:predicted transcriptional regulator